VDLGVDLRERLLVGRQHALRQDAVLAILDAPDRDHRDAARQLVEMRPRPFGVERPQNRLLLRDDRERLDEDRSPSRRPAGRHAGLDQVTDIDGARQRDEGHAHRGVHEVDDEAARQ
jgi:hypothetical protein